MGVGGTLPRRPAQVGSVALGARHGAQPPTAKRLMLAASELACRGAARTLSAEAIADHAGSSLEEFERYFDGPEACLAAAFDEAARSLRWHLQTAVEPCDSWDHALQALIDAALGWLTQRPAQAHLCLLAPLRAGRPLRCRQQRLIVSLTAALNREHERLFARSATSALAFELFIGAARELLVRQLQERPTSELTELSGRLREMAWLIDPQFPLDG